MSYIRKTRERNNQPHPLETEFGFYKQLSSMSLDSGWEQNFLADLHDESRLFLSQITSVLSHIKAQDYSDFKKEVADRKRADLVRKSREILLSSLKKHIDSARDNVSAINGKILRISEVAPLTDINKNLERLFLMREVRDELRLVPPADRGKMVEGNLLFLQACISSPTDILSKEHLEKLRVEYAFQIDPSLETEAKDARLQYKKTRERCASINATAVMMLNNEKIPDPISPDEHFQIFPPEDPHEQALADKQILSYNREVEKQRRTKEFEESHPGVNLGGESLYPERRLKQVRG